MRWKSYITAVVWIAVLRFLDLYITYRYTPDLQCEWNPLVSLFGFSWAGFIVAQIIVVVFVASLMYFYFNRKPVIIVQDGLSFDDFIYAYFFGKPLPWPARMFSLPTNPQRHLVFNGFIFMAITIGISGFAIVNNLLLAARVEWYVGFVARYYTMYFPVCFAATTVLSLYFFFSIEYGKYRKDARCQA